MNLNLSKQVCMYAVCTYICVYMCVECAFVYIHVRLHFAKIICHCSKFTKLRPNLQTTQRPSGVLNATIRPKLYYGASKILYINLICHKLFNKCILIILINYN